MGEGGQKVQTSRQVSPKDIMYNTVTTVNYTSLHNIYMYQIITVYT